MPLSAQELPPNQKYPKVVQSSPNAASLGKYGDIPVSMHTGIPNVSIPLYELKEGNINLPLSLDYHAGGIRVSEIASWVGLGWTLNSGGVITRSIQHVPDEGPIRYTSSPSGVTHYGTQFHRTGYYKDGYYLPCFNDNTQANNDMFQDAALGNMDTEPDIFFYNIGGYSGKFMFKVERDNQLKIVTSRTPIFIPKADIKVEVTFQQVDIPMHYEGGVDRRESFYSFILTTPDGIRYHFGGSTATEYSGTESYNNINYEFSTQARFSASA